MTKKTIQFNPNYFTLSGKKTLSKKEKKRNVSLANPNKIKKQLIMKIKEFQKRENRKENTGGSTSSNINIDTTDKQPEDTYHSVSRDKGLREISNNVPADDDIDNFEDEFNKSLNFLQQLSNKNSKEQSYKQLPYHLQNSNRPIVQQNPKNTSLKPRKFLSQENINIDYPDNQTNNNQTNNNQTNNNQTNNNQTNNNQTNNNQTNNQNNFSEVNGIPRENIENSNEFTITINSSKLKTDPPYSILKNGSKPTYRQWIRETQKVHSHHQHQGGTQKHQPIIIENKPANVNNSITERSRELSRIKEHLHNTVHPLKNQDHNIKKTNNTIKAKKITKTVKRKLGKSGKKISILIKNRETRKKIQTEKALLNRKNITEIKQYLRDHNLIKTGTTAPNHILRHLYENSILSGEINNNSSNVLLHNFINK
jgi:hypothetical protein